MGKANSSLVSAGSVRSDMICSVNVYLKCTTAALGIALAIEASAASDSAMTRQYQSILQNAPLCFEAIPGSNGISQFRARGGEYDFQISAADTLIVLSRIEPASAPVEPSHRHQPDGVRQVISRSVRLRLEGADPKSQLNGSDLLAGKINYLRGNDPEKWRVGIPTFSKVHIREVYPGVDLVYYGNQKQLEYDFRLQPNTDPRVIVLNFEGSDPLRIDEEGQLVIGLDDESMVQPRPVLYQVIDGQRKEVTGGYRLLGANKAGFTVGEHDPRHPLVIDPVLSYSSFFGGNSGDIALSVRVDGNGFIYVAGETLSSQFPLPLPPGGFQSHFRGGKINGDAFVAKFDPNNFGLVYFTYLGGAGNDGATDLAVDAAGQASIAGFTDSGDFPTRHALFPTIGGNPAGTGTYYTDAFVAQLNSSGSDLIFSTYLGGSGLDVADAIAIDPQGYTYVSGYTYSTNFPVTSGSLTNAEPRQDQFHGVYDGFIAKLAPTGIPMIYSTYLGGTNSDEVQGIAADADGFAYVTGYTASTNFPTTPDAFRKALNGSIKNAPVYDAFVAKVTPVGDAFAYSTLLGGTNIDAGFRIAIDSTRNAFVTGSSQSLDFPNTLTNLQGITVGFTNNSSKNTDAFFTKINADGSLGYSSRFGGTKEDVGWDIALDSAGNAFIVGTSTSSNFPTNNSTNFIPPKKSASGLQSVFVTAFSGDASASLYSLTLGGKNNDMGLGIATDPAGNVYIVGKTQSTNFPVVGALQKSMAGKNDSFLAKISMEPTLTTVMQGDTLALRWRGFAPEYRLETTGDATASTGWEAVSTVPVLNNGWHQVILEATNSGALFRLRRP